VNSKQKTEIRKRIETEKKNRGLAYPATAHRTSPLGAQPGILNQYASDQRDPPRGAVIFHLPIGEAARWRLPIARHASRCAPLLSNIYKKPLPPPENPSLLYLHPSFLSPELTGNPSSGQLSRRRWRPPKASPCSLEALHRRLGPPGRRNQAGRPSITGYSPFTFTGVHRNPR
jgi:hypothetical protein